MCLVNPFNLQYSTTNYSSVVHFRLLIIRPKYCDLLVYLIVFVIFFLIRFQHYHNASAERRRAFFTAGSRAHEQEVP